MSGTFSKDLQLVLKGLQLVRQSSATLANQRPIYMTRKLTNTQREEFQRRNERMRYERELAMEDQRIQEDMMKMMQEEEERQRSAAEQERTHNLKETAEEQVKQAQAQVLVDEKVQEQPPRKIKMVMPGDYKVDAQKGNRLYGEALRQKELAEQIEQEAGESTFGRSQQQQSVANNDDVPFFMRQDRPKFTAQERYVPASPASRAAHFGMLGVQLVGGTVAEAFKQKVGLSSGGEGKAGIAKYALNEKNADRLANNFKKMRGGALKIGQLLSTGEESVLPPIIRDAMEKARSEADIMPLKQVTKNLAREYGSDWQNNFSEINLYPFAAASIGQVHEAILKDGMRVALKMQYTGIAGSIDSDLNNFKYLADMLGIFPRGLYLNEAIDVARAELHWECNYEREAAYQRAYRKHLLAYPKDFYCPAVIDHLSTRSILCSEFVDGVETDTFIDASQEVRNRIGSLLISLCFKELFEFKLMQTDPNPANYLYDESRDVMNLIDFGAGRDFEQDFLDSYMHIIWGAYKDDKQAILQNSFDIGFLTGDENREMFNAQYKGTMIVGEPFRTKPGELYDFGQAGITAKVHTILPTLSKHRLTPPPQEVYSLHKKIIGSYLMCIKLRAQVPARAILEETYARWHELHGPAFFERQKDRKANPAFL